MDRAIIGLLKIFGGSSKLQLRASMIVMFLLFVLHLYLSFACKNFNWLAAYGALLTICSLLFSFTHILYPDFEKHARLPAKHQTGGWVLLPTTPGALGELISPEIAKSLNDAHLKQFSKKHRILAVSYLLSIIGTLVWAYSGFLNGSH